MCRVSYPADIFMPAAENFYFDDCFSHSDAVSHKTTTHCVNRFEPPLTYVFWIFFEEIFFGTTPFSAHPPCVKSMDERRVEVPHVLVLQPRQDTHQPQLGRLREYVVLFFQVVRLVLKTEVISFLCRNESSSHSSNIFMKGKLLSRTSW